MEVATRFASRPAAILHHDRMIEDKSDQNFNTDMTLLDRRNKDAHETRKELQKESIEEIFEERSRLIDDTSKRLAPGARKLVSHSNNNSDNNVSIRSTGGSTHEFNKFHNNNVSNRHGRHPIDSVELRTVALRTSQKHQLPMTMSSLRSFKSAMLEDANHQAQLMSGTATPHPSWKEALYYSDAVSVRSVASYGMGTTDGRKVTIRRVPTSPSELFNIAVPRG